MFEALHRQVIWGKATPPTLHTFALTATKPNAPTISAVASVMGDCLYLSYFIERYDWLDFKPIYKLSRADFLWEKDCLECFFDVGGDDYFEMNFSPDGKCNLYHFDNYRTPDSLPPVWADGMVFVANSEPIADYDVYHLGIKLDNIHKLSIHKINPTAILYRDGEPIFYAANHANPPDFHDKNFWQNFH